MRAARILLLIAAVVLAGRTARAQKRDQEAKQPQAGFVPAGEKSQGEETARRAADAERPAPGAEPIRREDEQAIRATAEAFLKAYNAQDARGLAALFAADAELVDESGDRTTGSKAIENEYAEFFDSTPHQSMELSLESFRLLGHEAATAEGQVRLTPEDGGPCSLRRYVALLEKQDGKWRFASVREEHDVTLAPRDRLQVLEWLVGDWMDEDDQAVVKVHTDWSADGNFLPRDFSVHVQGKPAMTVNERIGWDPLSRQIKSWVFDSAGGYGTGLWTQDGPRWVVQSTGVLPDGRVAGATHVIARVNDHNYHWASLGRTVGGRVISQTEEYSMVRMPPAPRPREKNK